MRRFLFFFIILIALGSLLLFAGIWYEGYPGTEKGAAVSKVVIGGAVFIVDVADTPTTRTQGLSGRPSLGENEGMLFIFPESDKPAFWMKDMNFALDMIWIGSDMHIVDITENALPESFPATFSPKGNAQYVLEVNAHAAANNGINIGDTVQFSK